MSDQLHVIFGTAALGQAVMRQLDRKGERVRMVSRGGRIAAPVEPVPAEVEVVKGDASDPASTREVCKGAGVVYHCAAPPYTDWATKYPPMQAGIIEGAAAAGAKLVSAESVYMYGEVAGEMTEDLPHSATTRKGQIRAQLAAMLMEAHQSGKVRAAIGRAPDFYGPGAEVTTIYGGRVFYPALAGKKVSVMGKLDLPHTFIYVDDFGRGLVTLGERDEALGQAWHLPCAPTPTQRELLTLIFEEAGTGAQRRQGARVGETPSLVFKMLSPFVPVVRELTELLYQWEKPYRFNHAKFERAFGAEVTPHREAVRRTVDWFRHHPQQ
jgi:nucleoside-diphosphate-sugar epimerase